MKMHMMLLAVALVLGTGEVVSGAELHWDFETGSLSPWSSTASGGASWSVTATPDAHSGSYSAILSGPLDGVTPSPRLTISFDPIPVSSIEDVRCWARSPDLPPEDWLVVGLTYEFNGSMGTGYGEILRVNQWVEFSAVGALPPDEIVTGLTFWRTSASSNPFVTTMLDDIRIELKAVPEPSTIAFFSLGLAGITWRAVRGRLRADSRVR